MNRRDAIEKMVAVVVAAVTVPLAGRTLAAAKTPDHHTVAIKGFQFEPATLLVAPGDRVTWKNLDFVPHTASALDGSWDTGELKANESADIVISDGSGLDYFCRHHPSMIGKLELS